MGKPTGFMEYQRQTPPDRSPTERINDWQEIHLSMADADLQTQGARCMNCGIPFCHTGELLNGMASGCPINNLIPNWNDLVYRGLWEEALELLQKTNNFPEFTGRVCPAPCEGSCTLSIHEPAVTIKNIEVSIINKAFDHHWVVPEKPARLTGKTVAVIGSGPAGLACAAQLNHAGHNVTVFERADRIGGLLMYGIPNMKLDKDVVNRRINLMMAEGVKFITNTEVGVDYPVDNLRKEFNAVVLCGGATQPRNLPIEGRELSGIHFAVDYLHANTKKLLDDRRPVTATGWAANKPYISAAGKDVIVIGGGDTGTDCVGSSLRQGCNSVTQFEILPCPPLNRQPDNPWPEWPRTYKVDYGHEEAAALYGSDPRHFNILSKKFVGDEQGNVKEIHTVQIEWQPVKNGSRPTFTEIPGTEKIWPAQLILICMGFLGPENTLLQKLGVAQDGRSNIKADYGKFATNIPGVFAAGDARRGQSLVVWAINEGRGAAREVDRYLMKETVLP